MPVSDKNVIRHCGSRDAMFRKRRTDETLTIYANYLLQRKCSWSEELVFWLIENRQMLMMVIGFKTCDGKVMHNIKFKNVQTTDDN